MHDDGAVFVVLGSEKAHLGSEKAHLGSEKPVLVATKYTKQMQNAGCTMHDAKTVRFLWF